MKKFSTSRPFILSIALVLIALLAINFIAPSSVALSSVPEEEQSLPSATDTTIDVIEEETSAIEIIVAEDSLPQETTAEQTEEESEKIAEATTIAQIAVVETAIEETNSIPPASSVSTLPTAQVVIAAAPVVLEEATADSGETSAPPEQVPPEEIKDNSSESKDDPYQKKIDGVLDKLSKTEHRIIKGLYEVLLEAFDEYDKLPMEERSLLKKVNICLSKAGKLKDLQAESDKEMDKLIRELESVLKEAGRDNSLAVEAKNYYAEQKSQFYSDLWKATYSGADGSCTAGNWLWEHYLALED